MDRGKLVVVGGGTAGWLTALSMLKHRPQDQITVIDNDDIGILGAGEGTVPYFHSFLDYVGISFSDLAKHCGATVKMGISFENWLGDGSSYFHGFLPNEGLRPSLEELDQWLKNGGNTDSVNFCRDLARASRVPFSYSLTAAEYSRDPMQYLTAHTAWSLHFDARKLASYFKSVALERGALHRQGRVQGCLRDHRGWITEIQLEGQQGQAADYVFDCTGFARRILKQELAVAWRSYSAVLGLDRALGFMVPHGGQYLPQTLSRAMDSGWLWQIPVQDRWGMGYVYSSEHCSADQALAEAEAYMAQRLEAREFKFSAGVLEETVRFNCLAVGLSQGFVEPLEATSIWVSLLTINDFIANRLLYTEDTGAQRRFNQRYQQRQEQILEFLRLHYVTPRRDTEFWQSVARDWQWTADLQDQIGELQRWSAAYLRSDGIFHNLSWLQVMSGLGLVGGQVAQGLALNQTLREQARSQCLTVSEFQSLIAKDR